MSVSSASRPVSPRRLFDRRPPQAAEAIASVETTSRQAIVDLHQIVGFLRRHGPRGGPRPQPGLERLPELIAQMRTAGLAVDYVVEGAAQRWSAAVELSAFRIVQEALTTVLRHAGPSRTTVRLRHERDGLDIEVLDEGHGSRQPSAGSRHHVPPAMAATAR